MQSIYKYTFNLPFSSHQHTPQRQQHLLLWYAPFLCFYMHLHHVKVGITVDSDYFDMSWMELCGRELVVLFEYIMFKQFLKTHVESAIKYLDIDFRLSGQRWRPVIQIFVIISIWMIYKDMVSHEITQRKDVDTHKSQVHDKAPLNSNINSSSSVIEPTKAGWERQATAKIGQSEVGGLTENRRKIRFKKDMSHWNIFMKYESSSCI